jgi:signal transduction histidine kinase
MANVIIAGPEAVPNILVVDDRKENLLATEKILKNLPAKIFKADSGNAALSLMLRHKFAVVLLDVQMPEMDGFEAAQLMQEHESMRAIPIIFVTAISKEEKYASRAADIGAVDYIFKPINADILRSKVKVYLDLYVQREQILKLNDFLRQSNEELERFAYICSHDMQEPVRMMHSYAEILEHKYADKIDEHSAKYLRFIIENARHMRKMISDILSFSRIGREDPEVGMVKIDDILHETLEKFEDTIAEKKAKITCGPLPEIEVCRTLLQVLFQNLIGNALKFQGSGKTPEISIRAKKKTEGWEFSVKDNGIGIDPVFHDKVFAIFQRYHRKENYPGTGIGLSTCKKFLEIFGGSISFESSPGAGSCFYFTIPDKRQLS